MKRIIANLLLIFVCLFAVNSYAEEFVVFGFEPGQFAVKGNTENILMTVIDIIKHQNSDSMKNILVIGSADQTGNTTANDLLSKRRAEEVAAILAFNFPDAKINVASKGDLENVRQAKILVEYIPKGLKVASITTKKDWGSWFIVLTAVILFILIIFSARKARKTIIANHFTPKKKETNVWISMKFNGKFYKYIPLLNDEGKMISPFVARNGEKYAFEKSDEGRRGLRNSVVSALKKDPKLFNQERDAGRLIEIGSVEKPVEI
jgi:hypothetical protein